MFQDRLSVSCNSISASNAFEQAFCAVSLDVKSTLAISETEPEEDVGPTSCHQR
jgi:hypothetical protein